MTSGEAARAALLGGGIFLLLLLVAGAAARLVAAKRGARRAGPPAEAEAEAPGPVPPPGPGEDRRPQLTLLTGPSSGTAYPVRPSTTIGRSSESDIAIDDLSASRRHALVRFQEGECLLADLGSANGTWANRVRISAPVPLSPGDIVTVGTTSFRFERAPFRPKAGPPPVPSSPAAWAPTMPTGTPAPRLCPGCGAPVRPGAEACPACGAAVG